MSLAFLPLFLWLACLATRALTSDPLAYQFGVLISILREESPDGPTWMPLWAWNPELGNTAVHYEPVFDENTAVQLAANGRDEMAKRLKARGLA